MMDGGPRILIVGGGYAGVEALAKLQDMAFGARAHYPELSLQEMRWILMDAADRILLEVSPAMAGYTAHWPGKRAWLTHRIYHLMRPPTMNRRLHVVSDWTPALLFPREVVSLDVLEHPRQDFQAALRVAATGPSRETSLLGREEKEAEHHAYHR